MRQSPTLLVFVVHDYDLELIVGDRGGTPPNGVMHLMSEAPGVSIVSSALLSKGRTSG